MASEELATRYPKNAGKKIGPYELFETQLVTLRQFAEHGILPSIDYGELASQKPDGLIINRVPSTHAVLVCEYKKPGGVTDSNWEGLADDLLKTKCVPTNSAIGLLTDGTKTYWINGRANHVIAIEREDGAPMPLLINFSDDAFLTELKHIINYFDPVTNVVRSPQRTNPDHLAKEVWQTIWRLRADNPEDCLATFIELFIFKFLDDLKLLDTNGQGIAVSLSHVMSLDKTISYSYYYDNVRPYIKALFPAGKDGYSIINGIILQKSNRDHNIIFHQILEKFIKFGTLKNTDTDFKRRLYESFLKQSKTASNFGQFFTPRIIVSAVHDMAQVEDMSHGKDILDPAAGVGGFVLEQMARDLAGQWTLKAKSVKCAHKYFSYEKVAKTSILAKANALVHCGDLLAEQPNRIRSFSKWLNETFYCYDTTALGTLERMDKNKFDLILTNPPFVVSGSRDYQKIINSENNRKKYYNEKSSGVEGLFIQYIVKSLKKNGEAWVILPESFFLRTPDRSIRNWVMRNCSIRFVALLPERVFYNTAKRVCIVNLSKRKNEQTSQSIDRILDDENTLLYAIGEIGETRDSKRFPCRSDLPNMVRAYKSHIAGITLDSTDDRAITISTSELYDKDTVNFRHFWSKSVAIELGLINSLEEPEGTKTRIENKLREIAVFLNEYEKESSQLTAPPKPKQWKKVTIGDESLFNTRIGKRVLKKEIYQMKTQIPVYSANIRKKFGYVASANAGGLKNGGCLWSIDSDWDCRGVAAGELYSITDHCGQLEILNPNIDPHYLARQVLSVGTAMGFNREYRPSLKVITAMEVELPINASGEFDLATMQDHAEFFEKTEALSSNIELIGVDDDREDASA